MKHQAITLVKFKALCARLHLPLWQGTGLLESIWLFAMHNARDGDLSRYTPAELAAWLEYDGDTKELIDALVETRWLDRHGDVLVIHDWEDHKPTWLKGVVARQLSAELSSDLSRQLSGTKSGTKRVRLGLGNKVNTSQGKGATKTELVIPLLPESIDTPCLREALGGWLEYKGGTYKPRGLKALVARLERRVSAHGEQAVVDAIERAMASNYEGWDHNSLFEGKAAQAPEPVSKIVTPDEYSRLEETGELQAIICGASTNGRAR